MNFTHGGNVFAIARACGLTPEELLDFSASINPLGPAPGVREAVAAAFDRIGHYPDSDCTELRQALAGHHGVEPAEVCVANGSTELIYLLPRLVPGRRALVVAPPFSEYAAALARDGWEIDYFDLDPASGFELPVGRLAAELKKGHDLLVLTNPGNPTGRLYDIAAVERLAGHCRERGSFLVLDEAFMDFCEEGSAKRFAVATPNLLVLRSLTKFYALPGLRLGCAIGSAPVIARLARLREPWSVNTLAQAAGLASLAATGYARETLRLVATERERLFAGLTAIAGLRPFPSATNYLFVEVTGGLAVAEIAGRLLAQRLLIRDCGNFRGLDGRFFRVAVRSGPENARLLEALSAAMG